MLCLVEELALCGLLDVSVSVNLFLKLRLFVYIGNFCIYIERLL